MRYKIRMDTKSAAVDIANIASKYTDEKIYITDGEGFTVNAKSVLGNIYAQIEFDHVFIECEKNHYSDFRDFIID